MSRRNGSGTEQLVQAALDYAGRGWAVFPLDGKRPIPGTHGHLDATTDPKVIVKWWEKWPDANVGIRCSVENGPVVIDIDGRDGFTSLSELGVLPATLQATSRTAKTRRHLYFSRSEAPVPRTIKFLPGLDLLGEGGYVVAPPSIHPQTGKPYRWINANEPVPLPWRVIRIVREKKQLKKPILLPEVLSPGERDDLLTSLAGSMRRRGASEDAILAALREENDKRCKPPLPDRDVRKIARSIAAKPAAEQSVEHLTDLGNARRFVKKFSRNARHVRIWKRPWVMWDGTRWAPDQTGEVERYAKEVVRELIHEAGQVADEDTRDQLFKHAIKSEAAGRIHAMIDLASTEPEVSTVASMFDASPWVLNVENGTIDLKKGEIYKPRRKDLITRIAPVFYDPKAKAPQWRSFLRMITEDDIGLQKYLKRAIGYSMSGDVREQCFFFCYGTGQNGKSTFLEVIRAVLGSYAQQTDFNTFLQKRGDTGPRIDIARMLGTRFVTASEASGTKQFDETVLKQLTGGDTIVARRLYEDLFEFQPTHKLWMAANHKPAVAEQTEAFWRRLRLLPFTVYIPPAKRDRDIKAKLMQESSGILNWMIEGCLDWMANGLGESKTISKAVTEYRSEEDLVGEFITRVCDRKGWISQMRLYRIFADWFRDTRGAHTRTPSPRWFMRSVTERPGIKVTDRKGRRGWEGLTIKNKD